MTERWRVRLFAEVVISAEVETDNPDQALGLLRRHIALQRHPGYAFAVLGVYDSEVRRVRPRERVARPGDGVLP